MQRSQRVATTEHVHEKNIGAEYGDFDYSSDISRNSSLGTGRGGVRVMEQGHEKPWYGGGSSVSETVSGQRNSFNVKHGVPNYPAPKLANANIQRQGAQSIVNRRSGEISSSWKNSEEEEFMWDDINSRLADHSASDVSSNFRKDRSASDDSDKSVSFPFNHTIMMYEINLPYKLSMSMF